MQAVRMAILLIMMVVVGLGVIITAIVVTMAWLIVLGESRARNRALAESLRSLNEDLQNANKSIRDAADQMKD